MKKVMFTAIAMIAFVGSSMGNTIAVEENHCSTNKSTQLFIQKSFFGIWFTRCDIIYMQTYAIAFEQFNNVDAANAIAVSAAETCADLEAQPKKKN